MRGLGLPNTMTCTEDSMTGFTCDECVIQPSRLLGIGERTIFPLPTSRTRAVESSDDLPTSTQVVRSFPLLFLSRCLSPPHSRPCLHLTFDDLKSDLFLLNGFLNDFKMYFYYLIYGVDIG